MMRSSILVLAAACATHVAQPPVYAPAGVTHWSDGRPARLVAVPPEAPHGYVELASFGVVELRPRGTQLRFAAVHVRLSIANDEDDTPWTLRPSEQLLELPGEGTSRAIYVNTDAPEGTELQVAKRDHRVVDLYYPLPLTIARAAQLPWFELHWQIATPGRTVTSSTRFEPSAAAPAPAPQVIFYAGWGSHWWFDPAYPDRVFRHPRKFGVLPHGPVVVRP